MTNNAFFFDDCSTEKPRLLGVSTLPDNGINADFGVVMCHAFSEERQKSYRSTFLFAQRLAKEGIPSLRFDYGGTGDSHGDMAQTTVATMVADTVLAFAESKRRLGVDKLVVLGIRFGAAIAVEASRQLSGLGGVVLWNPIVDGKAYYRELMRMEMIIRLGRRKDSGLQNSLPSGFVEIDAETISPEMACQIQSVDLAAGEVPATKFLIVGIENSVTERRSIGRLAERLGELNIDAMCWTEEERDYWTAESMYDEFHPEKSFDTTLAFLRGLKK